MTKKQRKAENAKQRRVWGISPVTRIAKNKKREKKKKRVDDYDA